jgi:phospholipase A2
MNIIKRILLIFLILDLQRLYAQCNEENYKKDLQEILLFNEKISKLKRRPFTRFSFLSILNDIYERYYNNSTSSTSSQNQALVRCNKDICNQEEQFLEKRKSIIKDKILELFRIDIDIKKVPKIAFVGSGGGYRAMTATFGAIAALKEVEIFDMLSYISGVSGSTWIIAALLANNIDIDALKNQIQNRISSNIESNLDIDHLVEREFLNIYNGQRLTSVTIWGEMLGDKFLSHLDKERYKYKLSEIANNIDNGQNPLPIFNSAIAFESKNDSAIYNWMEYTPYEIGCRDKGIFVPTWAFGRKFKKGKSINNLTEPSLEFLMGIWGSAFTATLNEALENFKNRIPKLVFNDLEKITYHTELGQIRFFPAELYNPVYKMKNQSWKKYKHLTLVDAGLDCNLGLLPVVQRDTDIIIVLDSSADIIGAPELKKAEKQARDQNLKFPKIDYTNIDSKNISIFKEEGTPTIIYIPLIQDNNYNSTFNPVESIKNGFCNTFNLCYSYEEFELLFGLTNYIVKSNKDIILNEIAEAIGKKLS